MVVHIHLAASSSSVGVSKGFVYLLLEVTIQHAYVLQLLTLTYSTRMDLIHRRCDIKISSLVSVRVRLKIFPRKYLMRVNI